MTTAANLRRGIVLPYGTAFLIATSLLGIGGAAGYYVANANGQTVQTEQTQSASAATLEDRLQPTPAPSTSSAPVTAPVIVPVVNSAPAVAKIERPATLQEIGGPQAMTQDYIVHVAKYVGQELGYPMDPNVKITFLSPADYSKQVSNIPSVKNSIAYTSANGNEIYIKNSGHAYTLLGLVLNESGKAQISYLLKQGNSPTMPSGKRRPVVVEAAAFAYQRAAQLYLSQLGYENLFALPNYTEREDLERQFSDINKKQTDPTRQGFNLLIYDTFNAADMGDLTQTLIQKKEPSISQQLDLFRKLMARNDSHVDQALSVVGPREYALLTEALIARAQPVQTPLPNLYDTRLP